MSDVATDAVVNEQATDAPESQDVGTESAESGVTLPQWVTSQLPEDLHLEDLAGYTKPADAIRELIDTKGKLAGAIIPPGDEATEEERNAYRERLGIPTEPTAYAFDDVELPEGMELDEATIASFQQKALDAGLTGDQAKQLVGWYMQQQAADREAFHKDLETNRQKAEADLRKEWGDQFDGNVRLMNKALRHFGGEEFAEFLDSTGLGNDPRMVKAFVGIGKAMVGDSLVDGDTNVQLNSREAQLREMYPKMYARLDAQSGE